MSQSRSFKDLVVWQKSLVLVKEVYRITQILPSVEQFGLMSQLRRATVSIPSNIAEGAKRGTQKDFTQFLRIASGSAAEIETQLILVESLYPNIDCDYAIELLNEVQKMLTALIQKIR